MNGAMKFISPDSMSALREGSLESRVARVRATAEANAPEAEVIAVFEHSVVLLSEGVVKRLAILESDGEYEVGPEEVVEVEAFDHASGWADTQAMIVAEAIGKGSIGEAREALLNLSEAVSKGNAYTAEGILRRMQGKLESRSSWVDVYATRERDIRAYIRGDIGSLRESIPSTRFRVLATEHAPEDPERFRADVVKSFEKVLDAYAGVVDTMSEVDSTSADLYDSFISLDEGMLLQNLTGFIASLRESAEGVSRDGLKFLHMESNQGDLARLARLHDLLAEGLEDYMICTTFVTTLVADIASGEK